MEDTDGRKRRRKVLRKTVSLVQGTETRRMLLFGDFNLDRVASLHVPKTPICLVWEGGLHNANHIFYWFIVNVSHVSCHSWHTMLLRMLHVYVAHDYISYGECCPLPQVEHRYSISPATRPSRVLGALRLRIHYVTYSSL